MTVEEVTAAGLAAAIDVAAGQGLPSGQARILSARGNLTVHLAPPPSSRGSRPSPLSPAGPARADGVDLGPHRHAGFAISLWTYLPPGPPEPTGPASAG